MNVFLNKVVVVLGRSVLHQIKRLHNYLRDDYNDNFSGDAIQTIDERFAFDQTRQLF